MKKAGGAGDLSFRGRVLAAVKELGPDGEPVDRRALWEHLGLATAKAHSRLAVDLSRLATQGRITRHEGGSVSLVETAKPLLKKEVMWRVLRGKRLVTATELAALAQVSLGHAKNYFASLQRLGLVQNLNPLGKAGRYRLLRDPGPEMPRDDMNEARRQFRLRKREALAALDAAFATVAGDCPGQGEGLRAIAEARLAVSRMEEE